MVYVFKYHSYKDIIKVELLMNYSDETLFLSETFFVIEMMNIGIFYNRLSKNKAENSDFFLEHYPIIFKKEHEFLLVNDCDYELKKALKKTNKNYRTLALVINQTNRSIQEIQDFYKLKTLKYLPRKNKFKSIIEEITSENTALKILCPKKMRQLGFINKIFCDNEIASQKLSQMNKEIHFNLCLKFFYVNGIVNFDDLSFQFLTSELDGFLNKKHTNKLEINLLSIIHSIYESRITGLNDIFLTIDYLKKNNNLNTQTLEELRELISMINKKINSNLSLVELIFEIKKIESVRNRHQEDNSENYDFIKNSLLDKKITKKIVDFLSEKILKNKEII